VTAAATVVVALHPRGHGASRRCRAKHVDDGFRRRLNCADRHEQVALQALDRTRLVRRHQGHHHAGGAGTGRASGAVHEVLGVSRRIEVDYGTNAIHVNPTGRHVGGHEGVGSSADESVQGAFALLLAAVAVDGHGTNSLLLELSSHSVSAMLGPGEDDGRPGSGHDLCSPLEAISRGHTPEKVHCCALVILVDLKFVASWVLLVATDKHIDVPVERRREQKSLAPLGGLVQETLDVGEEAHVGHAVCLVEYHDLHGVEADAPSFDQVAQTARAGHRNVDATGQVLQLRAIAHAAIEARHPQLASRGQYLQF